MSDKTKVLCKWTKKEYLKQLEEVKEIVSKPTHICKDCGRVANAKKWLCKPTKL